MNFYKCQAAGNDFIFVFDLDESELKKLTPINIKKLCHRKLGIGADGLAVIQQKNSCYSWSFYNEDGSSAKVCGNALKCLASLIKKEVAIEGSGFSFHLRRNKNRWWISMPTFTCSPYVESLFGLPTILCFSLNDHLILDATSRWDEVDTMAHYLRQQKHLDPFNLHFLCQKIKPLIRSFERGVREETLACASGALSVATYLRSISPKMQEITITHISKETTTVSWDHKDQAWIHGTGHLVFSGIFNIDQFLSAGFFTNA